MAACRLGRCAVPNVCPLYHCVCERILAFSLPHHCVGRLKQAGNVGTAVWWARNFYSDVAFADPVFAGRLPSLCTPSTSCSYEPVSQSESSGLRSPWGWLFIVFIVSISPLAIQRKDRGPYFGPSGFWYVALSLSVNAVLPINPHRRCWITHNYPTVQTVLEYAIVGSNGVGWPPMLFKRRILGVHVRFC